MWRTYSLREGASKTPPQRARRPGVRGAQSPRLRGRAQPGGRHCARGVSGDTSRRRRPREPREPEAGRRRRRRCSGAPRSGAHRRPPGAHQQALHTRAQRSRLPAASALAPCVCLCTSASLQNASCSISRTTGTSQWAYLGTRYQGRGEAGRNMASSTPVQKPEPRHTESGGVPSTHRGCRTLPQVPWGGGCGACAHTCVDHPLYDLDHPL